MTDTLTQQPLTVVPSAPDAQGKVIDITPELAGWKYVGFAVHKLEAGQTAEHTEPQRETCLVLLSGHATITAGDQTWEHIGDRMDVFEDKRPYAVYLPANCPWSCTADDSVELAVCTAPGSVPGKLPPRLIKPEDMGIERRGHTNIQRKVHDILPDTAEAESLLVVEVYVEDGNWSGYPPHKHDVDDMPNESFLEETYYHKVEPRDGFAFQRVYTEDCSTDLSLTVKHDQCILVPYGYHPLVAPPRHQVYFINVMAGPIRAWQFTEHQVHRALIPK